jgi:pyridinium-3,5-biscarboxylic acid mononucleotide sulfurtransferase
MLNNDKYNMLLKSLRDFGNAVVAFSGGVDSTFVLATARIALGNNLLAITVKTPYIPDWELEEAVEYCRLNKIRLRVIETGMFNEIKHNPENRCYICKKHLFSMLKTEATTEGFDHILDGTNADDSGVHRPGLTALKELGIRSPLMENSITKAEVRKFSAALGLPTADKPSYACLLTRLPYNYEVKTEELLRIEKAEVYLASLGYSASRVRNHGNIARIEIEKEKISAFVLTASNKELTARFRELGYAYITVDLDGYRSGSFDHKNNPS